MGLLVEGGASALSGVTRSGSVAPHALTVHNVAYSPPSSDEARSDRGPAADGLYVVSIVVEVPVSRFSVIQVLAVLAFVLFVGDAVAIGQLADSCSTLASAGLVTLMCLCVLALVVCTNVLDSRPASWSSFERDFWAYCEREDVEGVR